MAGGHLAPSRRVENHPEANRFQEKWIDQFADFGCRTNVRMDPVVISGIPLNVNFLKRAPARQERNIASNMQEQQHQQQQSLKKSQSQSKQKPKPKQKRKPKGIQIYNDALVAALQQRRVEFGEKELERFGVVELSYDRYARVLVGLFSV